MRKQAKQTNEPEKLPPVEEKKPPSKKGKKGKKKEPEPEPEPEPQLNDAIITDFCRTEGLTLLPVDPSKIPRFKMNLNTINYPLLICKALFIDCAHEGYMRDYEYKKDVEIL